MTLRRRHWSSVLTALALLAVATSPVFALNPAGVAGGQERLLSLGVDADPALGLTGSYQSNLLTQNALYGYVAVKWPLFTETLKNFDIVTGIASRFSHYANLATVAAFSVSWSHTEDRNANYNTVSYRVEAFPGYHAQNFSIAPHLAWQFRPHLHLAHRQYAKAAFEDLYLQGTPGSYQGPQDGWYFQNAHLLQFGLYGAIIRSNYNVSLTGGLQYLPNALGILAHPDVGRLPFYAKFQAGYAFVP